ncbi:MAG: type II toxin-antitoxin system PemK/MazF family toxin [Ilumatobacter sp.]
MKWLQTILRLIKQIQAMQAERDPMAGRTTKRAEPRNRRVEHGVRIEYSPELDGQADPGEVVWAWVPYQEDPNRGKDRPVVIVGRSEGDLAAVPLTSKNKQRADHVPVGTGDWDPKRRDSWAKVDRLITIDEDDVRREGAVLAKNRFDDVVGNLAKYHDVVRS